MKNQVLRSVLLLALISLCYSQLSAQKSLPADGPGGPKILNHMAAMDTSYWAIKEMADVYATTHPDDKFFMKRYSRWDYFWQNRIGSDGDFTKPLENMSTFRNGNGQTTLCDGAGTWTQSGPFTPDFKRAGIIVSVYSPPQHPDIIYAGSNTGGLWKTTNGGFHWECKTDVLGMPGMGVNTILGHPDPDSFNVIFIGTGFATEFYTSYGLGVFKSLDGGDNWRDTELSLSSSNPHYGQVFHKLLRNPLNPNVIYAVADRKLFRSDNNGKNWDLKVYGKIGELPVLNVELQSGEVFRHIEILPSDTNRVIISSARVWHKTANIWTSDDRGQTWDEILIQKTLPGGGLSPIFCENYNLATTADDPDAVYMTSLEYDFANPGDPGVPASSNTVLRRIDFSTTPISTTIVNPDMKGTSTPSWQSGDMIQSFLRPEFKINPENKEVMYVGGNIMYKSIDGGASFFKASEYGQTINAPLFSTHADIRAIQIYEADANSTGNMDVLIMGDDGGISKSVSGGVNGTWLNLNNRSQTANPPQSGSPLIVSQVFHIANSSSSPGVLFGGLQDNGTMGLINGNWTHVAGCDGGECIIDYAKPSIVYARCNPSLLQSVIGGALTTGNSSSFNTIHTTSNGTGSFDGFILDQSQQDPFSLFIGRNKNFKKLQTNPNGTSATVVHSTNLPFSSGHNITTFAVAPSNSDIVYLGKNKGTDKIHKSTDGGLTFQPLNFDKGAAVTSIAIHPEDPNRVWVSVVKSYYDAVYYSFDGGVNFNVFGLGLPHVPVTKLKYQKGSNNVLYAGTDVGVYRFNPATSIWECFNGTATQQHPANHHH